MKCPFCKSEQVTESVIYQGFECLSCGANFSENSAYDERRRFR